MLRTATRFGQNVAAKQGAPGLQYSACSVFKGEYPTHYIPAADAPEFKNHSQWTSKPFQINYSNNAGRFDYGRVEHPYDRRFLPILKQETQWTARQGRYCLYMFLWITPMALVLEEWYKREAEGKAR